jgi:hypothetical protein
MSIALEGVVVLLGSMVVCYPFYEFGVVCGIVSYRTYRCGNSSGSGTQHTTSSSAAIRRKYKKCDMSELSETSSLLSYL